MTKELKAAIEIIFSNLKVTPKKVLEIGSRVADNQDELCNLRPLLPSSSYIGVDMQAGVGVDQVADATKLPFPDNAFDLVICLETLEHAESPWLIASEVSRVIKNNGSVIYSSQQNFPLHMHPSDYFRYTPYGLARLLPSGFDHIVMGISPPYDKEVELNPKHVIAVGWGGKSFDKVKLKQSLSANISKISGHKPYRHRVIESFRIMRRAFWELFYRQQIKFFE